MLKEIENHFSKKHLFDRYCRLVQAIMKRNSGKVKHHILPSSMFPRYEKTKANILRCSEREHYILHLFLWKGVGQQMIYAFNLMSRGRKLSSKQYESLREDFSQYCSSQFSGQSRSESSRIKQSRTMIEMNKETGYISEIAKTTCSRTINDGTHAFLRQSIKDMNSEKMSSLNKTKIVCPNCGKKGQIAAMKRWHLTKCS